MALSITAAVAQSLASALATAVGSAATIQIRSGSKPATPETTASGTLLCTVTISGSFTASGGTAILDGTVTATGGGGDMLLGSTTITTGVPVDLGVPTFTVPVA